MEIPKCVVDQIPLSVRSTVVVMILYSWENECDDDGREVGEEGRG